METEKKRKEAYNYILTEKNGPQNEILRAIGNDLFQEFCLVGFIKQGMDGAWVERWQITEFGKSQISSYLELYNIKNNLNEIYNSILAK